MATPQRPISIGFVLYPNLTQLDLTGPWEVLTRLPGAQCHLMSHRLEPVRSASGLSILPTLVFAEAQQLDVLVVPGGPGHIEAMQDAALIACLRRQAKGCRIVSAVCTGTMILAAAGLLSGYRATTHWASMPRLAAYGVTAEDRRVVIDRNRITGGGVTAGIDFGLHMLVALGGADVAKRVQLQMEYQPDPPFAGHPSTADEKIVAAARAGMSGYLAKMAELDARLAAVQR
jgi:cyclohexyl-isocyanide hydratase